MDGMTFIIGAVSLLGGIVIWWLVYALFANPAFLAEHGTPTTESAPAPSTADQSPPPGQPARAREPAEATHL
jgi:hypothetical protein